MTQHLSPNLFGPHFRPPCGAWRFDDTALVILTFFVVNHICLNILACFLKNHNLKSSIMVGGGDLNMYFQYYSFELKFRKRDFFIQMKKSRGSCTSNSTLNGIMIHEKMNFT